ncbi:MAG: hypothetical protein RL562_164 [Planctomycetota bacterium]|jgi:uncharacterized membrane protein YeiB
MTQRARIAPLDAARGLAVAGMVWTHFVGTEGVGGFEGAASALTTLIYGREAALFFVLAGMSWAMQAARGDRVGRRALFLGLFGFVFGRTLWPTEVLVPLALCMPLVVALSRPQERAWPLALAVFGLVVAMPICDVLFGDYAWGDWNEDGTVHAAESTFGWVTLRYYLLTGNYPLVGWLVLPLLGALAVRGEWLAAARRSLWPAALALGAAALASAAPWLAELGIPVLDAHASWFELVWVPTTVPFVLREGGIALGVVFLCLRADFAPEVLARHGRASLTHYVAHIALVFTLLRVWWPDEDWPIPVGVAAFCGYWVFAHWFQARWFARHRRGPLEASWDAVADRDGGPNQPG